MGYIDTQINNLKSATIGGDGVNNQNANIDTQINYSLLHIRKKLYMHDYLFLPLIITGFLAGFPYTLTMDIPAVTTEINILIATFFISLSVIYFILDTFTTSSKHKELTMKTIKVKFAPDDKTFKDMGTVYLQTDNQDFIDGLAKITKYKEMTIYLDEYKHLYQELEQDPQKYDFTFDTSADMVKLVQDDSLPFLEKLK